MNNIESKQIIKIQYMNKFITLTATAVALAACAKNEVVPVDNALDNKITFNVAPKTKSETEDATVTTGPAKNDFSHNYTFQSYAYFVKPSASPQLYIDNTKVSYRPSTDKWESADDYYWPKQGSLTFFAWTAIDTKEGKTIDLVKSDDSTQSLVECSSETLGIRVSDFDVDRYTNVDLLVADTVMNRKNNVITYNHNGVPTLFKHKLAYVSFTVKTKEDYSKYDKTFSLVSIEFESLGVKGTYQQFGDDDHIAGWSGVADNKESKDYIRFASDKEEVITNTVKTLTDVSSDAVDGDILSYYIPQTFSALDYFTVTYLVKTKVGNATVSETVEKKVYLNTAETDESKKPVLPFADGKLEMGHKYTVNLTFSIDEITWDPAVEDWTEVNDSDIIIR